ncbi:zinc ribbon domain-containing protein [uncultured Enorma sp.]|uniref:zinc ribbon domain-containing protein n=1 Tax=uncultured Enorma sp. TaxID=1714346 RepID=UPI00265ECB7E|nr:zinc ribbon domain-containing protein [uncultured Enorma sp.]
MFCPKCGQELPDGSKFCPECGSPLTPKVGNQAQPAGSAASSSTAYAPVAGAKKSRKPLIIGGIAVMAVAAVVGVVLLVMNVFGGGSKLVNGKYIFERNNMYGLSYEVYEEDGEQKIDIGYAKDAYGISNVYYSGTFVEDGENDQGTIWKLVPDEDDESGSSNTTVRFQFPEGYAEGDVSGRWYLEQTTTYDDGTSETMFSIMEFFPIENINTPLVLVTAYGDGALDGGLEVQDVLDNEVSEREDIPEGKYYIMSSVDNYAGYYDVWLQVTAEGNGSYSVMAYQQDEEYHLSEYDWMNITIDPEE